MAALEIDKTDIKVRSGSAGELFTETYKIRTLVFVEEQAVPSEEEKDEYESICRHFLAEKDGIAVGTARWRKTDKGVKLERFAVLSEYRGMGIGELLVEKVIANIKASVTLETIIYCHAQIQAQNFWEKQGFEAEGEIFYEANIPHYYMKYVAK